MAPSLLIVVPTYNHFDYAFRAIRSALANTTTFRPHVLAIDDASPDRLHLDPLSRVIGRPYGDYLYHLRLLRDEFGEDSIMQAQFDQNGGLTRSWNVGLTWARERDHDFCCVTNSDVLFAPGWDSHLFTSLNTKLCDLAGPVTNAPGTNPVQYVAAYSTRYNPGTKDDVQAIAAVQSELSAKYRYEIRETTLNGFCMVAFTKTWWDNAYDRDHVFRPRNDFDSQGRPNPTPLMTLNEYELQRRWKAGGLKAAACLGSYVYHYRAVSRGVRHRRGDWARMAEK